MIKRISTAAICLVTLAASAQNYFCYTTEMVNKSVSENPAFIHNMNDLERFTSDFEATHSQNRSGGNVKIVPVVFHIVHNYGPENISDAQVYDAMRILNEDFRLMNADTVDIVTPFKNIAGDAEIEFRLATKDPNGNCTNGIDRIPSLLTYRANDDSKLNPWPSNRYLNIWVIYSFESDGVAGYSYYPGTAPPGADGVIVQSGYVGSIGTGSYGRSRVVTHEVGHWLNLRHVWGNTNNPGVACGNDQVNDTPITKGWTSCILTGSVCNPPIIENVQNHMEYAFCSRMFTQGQGVRMQAALNSTTGGRNNLFTAANHALTGIDVSSQPLCAPVCDFTSDKKFTCAGKPIQFIDLSWNGTPSSWQWSFPGGTPSSSTDTMPVITYGSNGIYPVTLRVSNASGSDSLLRSSFILVADSTPQGLPFAESFENNFPGTDAYVLNPDNGTTWIQTAAAAATGTKSMRINNFTGNSAGEIDEFITPDFDFSQIPAPQFTFKLAYAQRDTSVKEMIRIYFSYNCGDTWTMRYQKSGQTLATSSPHTTSFVPTANDWRLETVNIGLTGGKSNVRFKIQHTSAGGNNLFIDDINIVSNTTGIGQPDYITGNYFEVFPNPADGRFVVSGMLENPTQLGLKIFDLSGRCVTDIPENHLPRGDFSIPIQAEIPPGIYFISVTGNNRTIIQKLVITK